MAVQATVLDGIANAFGNAAAVLIGIVAVTILCFWFHDLPHLLDTGVPWRQIMGNRNLEGLVLSCRIFYTISKLRLLQPAEPIPTGV